MKPIRSLAIALGLVALTGTAVAAHCDPPPEPLRATICIWGDPHAVITVVGTGTVKLVYTPSLGDRTRKVIEREVDGVKVFRRLVKGGTPVAAWQDGELLDRVIARSNGRTRADCEPHIEVA